MMPRRIRKRAARGFLLLEQLIVVALAVLMLGLALQGWTTWQQAGTARQLGQQWSLGLARLRQQALSDGQALTLCASRDGSHCQAVWSSTWLAFADANGDGLRQPTEPRLSFGPPIPASWRLVWKGFRPGTGIIWSEWGDAPTSNGTLTLCAPKAQDSALRQWVLSKSGRVRLVLPASSAATLATARAVCAGNPAMP